MNSIVHFYYTSKPYSYIGQVSMGILIPLIIKQNLLSNEFLGIGFFSLLSWLYFNWQSDFIQKDKGKIRPPLLLLLLPLFAMIMIIILHYDDYRFFWIIPFIISVCLYSYKALSKKMGKIGPFLRFITVIGFSVMILGILGTFPKLSLIKVIIIIAIFKALRNLIGDIRDMKTDMFELPVILDYSKIISIIRYIFILLNILTVLFSVYVFAILFWVNFSWIFFEILNIKFGKNKFDYTGYFTHRFLTVSITFLFIHLCYLNSFDPIYCIVLVLSTIFLQYTYSKVPGKNYPKFSELIN